MIRYLQAQYIVPAYTSLPEFRLARSRKMQVSQKNGGCTLSQRYGWLAGVAHSHNLAIYGDLRLPGLARTRQRKMGASSKYAYSNYNLSKREERPSRDPSARGTRGPGHAHPSSPPRLVNYELCIMYCTGEDRRGYRILFAAKVAKRVTDVGVKGGTLTRGARGGGMQGRGRDLWNLGGMSCWWSGKSQNP